MEKRKKFKVYDLTDGKDVLGYADNMQGVKKLGKEQYEATDGDCQIHYIKLDKETNKYKWSQMEFLESL